MISSLLLEQSTKVIVTRYLSWLHLRTLTYGVTSALDKMGTRNAASRINDCFRCLRFCSALSCIELVRSILITQEIPDQ